MAGTVIDGTHVARVAIIGAGIAGIQTARMLKEQGLQVTVFEKQTDLGGVWTAGYEGYGVQVKKCLYEFPDYPLPEDAPEYVPGQQFLAYVKSYVAKHDLESLIRVGTPVSSLVRRSDGQRGWTLTYEAEGAKPASADFDLVVVCTGMFSKPHVPEIRGRELFQGKVLHSSECLDMTQFSGKKVVCFGCGKSACDICEMAAPHAASVTTVFAKPHWPVPRNLAELIPFEYATFSRFGSALLPLYLHPGAYEKALHTLGAPLVWLIWRTLEQLLKLQLGIPKVMRSDNPLEKDVFTGGSVISPGYFPLVHKGKIVPQRASIDRMTPTHVILSDGVELPADFLVLATGYDKGYEFLPQDVIRALEVGPDGHFLFRHIIHPDVHDLAFVGSNIHTFSNITTAALQARWLSQLLLGKVNLPSADAMRDEISAMKAWKHGIAPSEYNRSTMLNLHQLHYHDELVKDIGKNPKLKSNFLAELFVPYRPNDYKTIVA